MIYKELHMLNVYDVMSLDTYASTHDTMTTIEVTDIPNTSQSSLVSLHFCLCFLQ